MFPSNQAEAEAAWKNARSSFQDAASAEAWFLVTLVRRGRGRDAIALATRSGSPPDLAQRVRRAILCISSGDSSALVSAEDVKDDPVGAFLRAPSTQARMEFLRERTAHGKESLPVELWSGPDMFDLVKTLGKFDLKTDGKGAKPTWYKKDIAPGMQFGQFLRLHAYGQYSFDNVDPHLLAALVAWDDRHPEETTAVLESMWKTVSQSVRSGAAFALTLDIYRNSFFERCQSVLVARPEQYVGLFVEWMKTTLVDQPLRIHSLAANTIQTLSMKPETPFLFCLLGAQKLASLSPQRRDALLMLAMNRYRGSGDAVTWAAGLYASDKGLSALAQPAPKQNSNREEAWQTGIVDASKQQILGALGVSPGAVASTLLATLAGMSAGTR
jgi:hypothetical protein